MINTSRTAKKLPAAVALGRLGGKAKSERKTLASRANAKKPRALKCIESEGMEFDGTYCIYLKPGFIRDGTHAIYEDTKREALAWLVDVEPCDCAECLELIAKAKA